MLDAQTAPDAATFTTSPLPETSAPPALKTSPGNPFAPLDTFARRHIGPQPEEVAAMLEADFARCRRVDLATEYARRPWWFKAAVRAARLLSPVQ